MRKTSRDTVKQTKRNVPGHDRQSQCRRRRAPLGPCVDKETAEAEEQQRYLSSPIKRTINVRGPMYGSPAH
jgi:hypothetical protein